AAPAGALTRSRGSRWRRSLRGGAGAELLERRLEVPWHPLARHLGHTLLVTLERDEVVERVRTAQLRGVDQAHEQVTDSSPVLGLVEHRVLAVKDRLLQRALTDVVVERRSWHAQEQRQLGPVLAHVGDRFPEAGVGLDLAFLDLVFEPAFELLHQRLAVGLV